MLPLTHHDQLKGDDFKPGIKIASRLAGWLKYVYYFLLVFSCYSLLFEKNFFFIHRVITEVMLHGV